MRTRRDYNQVPGAEAGYSGDPVFWAELFQSLELSPDQTLANSTTHNVLN